MMKRLVRKTAITLTLAILMIVSVRGGCAYVYAVDDYPEEYKNAAVDTVVDRWNFYNRECTSFVAWCLNSRNGVAFTNQYGGVERWGHAKDWGTVARSQNIAVDDNPKPGAVAWTASGKYGHVAWVVSVSGNDVKIEEYNYVKPVYNERTVNKNEFQYIHIKDLCSNHKWDSGKVTKKAIHTRTKLVDGEKTYTCTVCGETKTEAIKASHRFETTDTKAATLKKNGSIKKKCSKCGKEKTVPIYRPKIIKVKKSIVTYTGKSLKPGVVIKDVKGKNIPRKYYSVSYKNNKKLGTATVSVKFKDKYSESKSLHFKIVPRSTKLVKCTGGSKRIKATWKRVRGVDGYQIQYATKNNFSNKKTITVKGNKSVSKVIKSLSAGKKYFVRVRTYKTVGRKRHYSLWSNVMFAKTLVVSERSKALKTYKSFLEKQESGYNSDGISGWYYNAEEFALYDINSDGIPELFVHGGGQMDYSKVFTYKSGKMKKVYVGTGFVFYPNGTIETQFNSGSGYTTYSYYSLNSNCDLSYRYRYTDWHLDYPDTYTQGEDSDSEDAEEVDYSVIESNVSRVTGGSQAVSLSYHTNSKSNRDKYVK